MGELDALGEAVTGGAAARAVEPRAGAPGSNPAATGHCRNCGCLLTGAYCHCCGQPADVHRTLGAWWHDFVHSVLHLDGKALRTLPMLAWRPGDLTRRYIAGERAKFISPLALFLFTVFLMFAVMSAFGPAIGDLEISRDIDAGIQEERDRLQRLESRAASAPQAERARIAADAAETRADIARLERLKEQGIVTATFEPEGEVQGDAMFQAAYSKAKRNPELLIYKMQANAYKFGWALIPISVPFVWMLFLHRKRYRREFGAYDHLVFVTYSIAFMSLALILWVLAGRAGLNGPAAQILLLAVPPLHMYRQLRGAYGLSRVSAAWRAAILSVLAIVALGLFALMLVLLGVLA